MTDQTNRDDLLWLGASLCRAKDRAAAAERRVEDLEAAAEAVLTATRHIAPGMGYTSEAWNAVDLLAATVRGRTATRKPQDTPEPPTLPDPVPDRPEAPGSIQEAADSLLGYLDTSIRRPEAPGVCWACGGQYLGCGICHPKPDP